MKKLGFSGFDNGDSHLLKQFKNYCTWVHTKRKVFSKTVPNCPLILLKNYHFGVK